jgi:hypothetical protein
MQLALLWEEEISNFIQDRWLALILFQHQEAQTQGAMKL